jgi:hypothetical protein
MLDFLIYAATGICYLQAQLVLLLAGACKKYYDGGATAAERGHSFHNLIDH